MLYRDSTGALRRGVTVEKLTELLAQLRDDDVVEGNAVGNLLVSRDELDIAYIDFGAREAVRELAPSEEDS